MSRSLSRLVLCAALLVLAATRLHAQVTWNLVWSDEFNGAAGTPPDSSKWTYDLGGGGWGNNELETYTNSTANAAMDGNGNLVITAIKNPDGSYTSARIKTQGLFTFRYGRAEANIKLPFGAGLWPAFWMLGSDITTASWPQCGELDIMESVSQLGDTNYQASIHATGYNGGSPTALPSGETVDGQFHIYGIIWSPGLVQYYLDSPSNIVESFTPPAGTTYWPFDDKSNPFFFILNLAVGGSWGGAVAPTTVFPASMYVDYVRVYQAAAIAGPAITGSSITVNAGSNGTSQLQLSGTLGSGKVYLQCSGAPAQASCSISPNVVDFTSSSTATATLTVTTTAHSDLLGAPPAAGPREPLLPVALLVGIGGLLLAALPWARRRYALAPALAMAGLAALMLTFSGCGGGSSSPTTPSVNTASGTPAGNYSLTVTAYTVSGDSSTANVGLTVN